MLVIVLFALLFAAMILSFVDPPYGHVRSPSKRRLITVAPGDGYIALRKAWGSRDPALAPLADAETKVADLESFHGVRLPDEFRHYLLTTAPTGFFMAETNTTWWTVENIRNIRDEWQRDHPGGPTDPGFRGEGDRFLIFADYISWCYAWAICCSEGEHRGKVILEDYPDQFVANTFSQFVELELSDSPAIHPGAPAVGPG